MYMFNMKVKFMVWVKMFEYFRVIKSSRGVDSVYMKIWFFYDL